MSNGNVTTQSVQDADKAAETAETAAVSARKAADKRMFESSLKMARHFFYIDSTFD